MPQSEMSLYEPINQYKPLGTHIGVVDGPLVYMAYPGLSFLKMPFTTRMTVAKLANGDLWLHSPTAYDDDLAQSLAAMGPIRHLVSPNKIHYAHIKDWKDAFPHATAWASPGVRQRARSQGVPARFDADLSDKAPDAWRTDFDQVVIPGSFLDEVVFFHRASQTLILADGIENFELSKLKQPYRFFVWATGAYHPHGKMPIDLRATFWAKKQEVGAAARKMISWAPERIVLSHGRLIEQNAVEALRYAFRWAL